MPNQRNVSQRRQHGCAATGTGTSTSLSIPFIDDIEVADTSKIRRRSRRHLITPCRIAIVLLTATLIASIMNFFWSHRSNNNKRQLLHDKSVPPEVLLPLSKYSELTYALEHSDLVALYFAASWCGMSTPVSHILDETFGTNSGDGIILSLDGERKPLSIVYVSSDRSLEDYNNYIEGRNWLAVPYDSPQITQLKQHFHTCARPEMEVLGIEREHEIPTIIVIDSKDHEVLTSEGVKDVKHLKAKALDYWKELSNSVKVA